MTDRDYKVRDHLEEEVDYSKRKKKNKKGLVWDEYEVVSAISDIITRTIEPSEVRQLAMKLQDFIGNPEKYDPYWHEHHFLWNRKDQRLEIAKSLEKKLREDIRFKEYKRS